MTCRVCNRVVHDNRCGCWPLARPTLRGSDAPAVWFADGWLMVDWSRPLAEIRREFAGKVLSK